MSYQDQAPTLQAQAWKTMVEKQKAKTQKETAISNIIRDSGLAAAFFPNPWKREHYLPKLVGVHEAGVAKELSDFLSKQGYNLQFSYGTPSVEVGEKPLHTIDIPDVERFKTSLQEFVAPQKLPVKAATSILCKCFRS